MSDSTYDLLIEQGCTCDWRTVGDGLSSQHDQHFIERYDALCPFESHATQAANRWPPQTDEDAEEFIDAAKGREVTNYVDKAMYASEETDADALERPRVHLLSATQDPLGALAAQCMIYEGRVIRSLGEITDDERRSYFDDIFHTTLQSPLEDIDFHFMVEGLTRATWDQMVRQRTANFGGESLRFAVKDDLRSNVRPGPNVGGEFLDERTKRARLKIHDRAVAAIELAYHELIANGVPAEDARGLLPMNVLTRGHWKTNLRNLMTEIGKRTCTQAQFEWRQVIGDLRESVRNYSPPVFGHEDNYTSHFKWQFEYIADSAIFQPICFHTGRCMFKAKADRGCTIRERVEEGRFDEIDEAEWKADPNAAWVR